ncbi:hypothetical protein ABBQ32_009970 [Trebouxia sp. C0010 RCD-2024]
MLCNVSNPHARMPLQKAHFMSTTRSLGAERYRTGLSCKSGSTVPQRQSDGTTPASASEVRRYARQQFQAEVDPGRPDAQVNLAKACMLISLEEEAALEEEVLQSNSSEVAWLSLLSDDVQQQDELEDVELSVVNRGIGTASSWSLSRLDALADEVRTCFLAAHTPYSDNSSALSTEPSSDNAALLDRQASNSSAGSSVDSFQGPLNVQGWQPFIAWAVSKLRGIMQKASHLESLAPGDTPPLDPVVMAMQQYPMQTVAAINTVLFEQHGYNRMQLHGNPRDAQLSSVLDNGTGHPTALAVLYMEVARRLGSPMVVQLLEGGRQCLIWPEHGGLSAQGEDFVIDPYSQGALYSRAEASYNGIMHPVCLASTTASASATQDAALHMAFAHVDSVKLLHTLGFFFAVLADGWLSHNSRGEP